MKVQNGGAASGRPVRLEGVAATIATVVSLRQRPLERRLYLLTKSVVAEQVSGVDGLADCIERFRFQNLLE